MSSNNPEPERVTLWIVIVVVLRVLLILAVWIGLFLGMFLGYFTVPILLLGLVTLIYTLTDAGLLVTLTRRKNIDRQEMLRKEMRDAAAKRRDG